MQVYGFCNLHDLSWGNRPATHEGTSMITDQKKQQEELKKTYQMFRVNMVILWMLCNFLYMTAIISWNSDILPKISGPGWTFVEVFAAFMGGMVIFKTVFASFHIVYIKLLYSCIILIPKIELRKYGRKFGA